MSLLSLLLAAALAAPQVEVSTLDGQTHKGELSSLSAAKLTLKADAKSIEVATKDLLNVRFPQNKGLRADDQKTAEVVFVDGSRIEAKTAVTSGRQIVLESPLLGRVQLPLLQIASIRYDRDPVVDDQWNELLKRKVRQDLLVVKKKGDVVVLDFLDGIVERLTDQEITFVLDGNEVPVSRDKVFGIIYARAAANRPAPAYQALLPENRRLMLSGVSFDGQRLVARLLAGADIELPLDAVQELDFSLGKIRYLSQMEPREIKYTPYFDDEASRYVMKLRRDRNQENGPLTVGRKTYPHGLWIHSKTYVKYYLGGEYRKFQAVMGIEGLVAGRGCADMQVTISGDGKPLLEAHVRDGQPPRDLDLDVSDVEFLEILVDYGDNMDICDHLALGNARLIK